MFTVMHELVEINLQLISHNIARHLLGAHRMSTRISCNRTMRPTDNDCVTRNESEL